MSNDKKLYQALLELDFTPNDAQVYLALTKHGTTNAGPVIKDTGLHRNIVYTSLASLIRRKLVTERTIRGRKRFAASAPSALRKEYDERAQLAKNATQELEKRIQRSAREITIHEGNEEFSSLLLSMASDLPKSSEMLVLGAGGDDFINDSLDKVWDEYVALLKQRKLKVRLIAYEAQRERIEEHLSGISNYSIRFLDDDMENPSGIQIYPKLGEVLNLIYPDENNPVSVIRISSEKLCQGNERLFANLWKNAAR